MYAQTCDPQRNFWPSTRWNSRYHRNRSRLARAGLKLRPYPLASTYDFPSSSEKSLSPHPSTLHLFFRPAPFVSQETRILNPHANNMNFQASRSYPFSIRHNSMTLPTLGIKRDVCASHSLAYSNACFLFSISFSSPSFLPTCLIYPNSPFLPARLYSSCSCSYNPSNLLLYLFCYFLSPAIRSWLFIHFVINSLFPQKR